MSVDKTLCDDCFCLLTSRKELVIVGRSQSEQEYLEKNGKTSERVKTRPKHITPPSLSLEDRIKQVFCLTKKKIGKRKKLFCHYFIFQICVLIVELTILVTCRGRFQRCNLRGIPGKTISSLDDALVIAVKMSEKRLCWKKVSIASLVEINTVIVFAAAFTFKTFP